MGKEYLFLKMNELFRFDKILVFSERNFCFGLAFLFVDLEFSFLPLKCFIYFKHRSFRSGIVAKDYAGLSSFSLIHEFAEFLPLKYIRRVKVSRIIAL